MILEAQARHAGRLVLRSATNLHLHQVKRELEEAGAEGCLTAVQADFCLQVTDLLRRLIENACEVERGRGTDDRRESPGVGTSVGSASSPSLDSAETRRL